MSFSYINVETIGKYNNIIFFFKFEKKCTNTVDEFLLHKFRNNREMQKCKKKLFEKKKYIRSANEFLVHTCRSMEEVGGRSPQLFWAGGTYYLLPPPPFFLQNIRRIYIFLNYYSWQHYYLCIFMFLYTFKNVDFKVESYNSKTFSSVTFSLKTYTNVNW